MGPVCIFHQGKSWFLVLSGPFLHRRYTYRQLMLLTDTTFVMRCMPALSDYSSEASAWGLMPAAFICTMRVQTNPHLGDCTVTFAPTFSIINLLGRPVEISALERRRTVQYSQGQV